MRRTLLVVLCALLLTGCGTGARPTGKTAAPVADQQPAPPPAAPADRAADQPAPPPAAPSDRAAEQPLPAVPPPPVGVKVWAVDTAGAQPAELLFHSSEPLQLEGVSPDGRYWLFEKVLGRAMGDPSGFMFLLDRTSGALTAGPHLDVHPAKVAWSGRGFWVNDLLHLGLDLQVADYARLREALALGPDRRVLAGSFTADGSRVALVIDNGQLNPSEARADLVWAEAGGSIIARADHSVQPWAYYGKSGPYVSLAVSPGGEWIVLMGQSPGAALISTGALDPTAWQPLLGPLEPPVPVEKVTGGPPGRPRWAPDGTHLWLPAQSIVDPVSRTVVTVQQYSPWAVWKPDGTGLVTQAEPGTSQLRLVTLDGQGRDFPVPEWAEPVAFLPDGRLLVARSVFP